MEKNKEYFLCGGVLFFLLKQAALPNGTPRDHKAGVKDEHSDPILMQDLIYTFTGSQHYGAAKDTSKYKNCLSEGSYNLPFNDTAICSAYDSMVNNNYATAIKRMDEFVSWHINSEMSEWLLKALLEIIESDNHIHNDDSFFIQPNGQALTITEIINKEHYDLSAFLVGILPYILSKRRGQNTLGNETLKSIGEKNSRKARKYTGDLGVAIKLNIHVDFLPRRLYEDISVIETISDPSLQPIEEADNTNHHDDAVTPETDNSSSEKRIPLPTKLEPELEKYVEDNFNFYKGKNIAVKTPQLLYMLLQYKNCDIIHIFNSIRGRKKHGYGDFLISYFSDNNQFYLENNIHYQDENKEEYLEIIKDGLLKLTQEFEALNDDEYQKHWTSLELGEYIPAHILCYFFLSQHNSNTLEEIKSQLDSNKNTNFFNNLVECVKINKKPTVIIVDDKSWE